MDFKKKMKKYFENDAQILEYRYLASKNIFMYVSFLFFLNYFFVGAKFFDSFFVFTLPFLYLAFVVCFLLFVYFFIQTTFHTKSSINMVMMGVGVVLFFAFLLPFSGISF